MAELRISLDAVSFVILKARELEEQGIGDDDDHGSDPIDRSLREALAAETEDSTHDEVETFIDGLNEDEQVDLVALTWMGRGDYTVDQWSEARRAARSRRTGVTSRYLLGIPVLADYLEEGLAAFGLSSSAIDDQQNGHPSLAVMPPSVP
jgi:hypothetical protein